MVRKGSKNRQPKREKHPVTEAPLHSDVTEWGEASVEGENWDRLVRYRGRKSNLRPDNYPTETPYKYFRVSHTKGHQ
jgi:hypothetical protein